MPLPLTLADFEREAEAVMEPGPHGYYAGGAGDEVTLADNVAAWRRIAIRPRVLVDVTARDLGTVVLGKPRPHPLIVAPTAFHKLATPEGEVATALAAGATGSTYTLSSLATAGVAEIADAAPGTNRWFQLYVFKDRGVSRDMVATAVERGYEAIVLTVDMPILGTRERDLRTGFVVGHATAIPSVDAAGGEGTLTMPEVVDLIDASLTWADVELFAADSGLPVLVKGILTPEDARLAVRHGAAGVVVSNHGGRQLDTVLSGADALEPIAEEVGGEIDVIVDGGVRRGTDVLKALALGASAVLVGRPVLWGLAVGGEDGARRVLEMLLGELDTAIGLAGVPRAADLSRAAVQRAPWA